jgi:hypothetical protein
VNKDLLRSFIGKTVKIDRGGHESSTGFILGANKSHFAVYTENDGIVYYQYFHIKSLTEYPKKDLGLTEAEIEQYEFKDADDFTDLLHSSKHQWVKINRGGPEKLEGILEDANADYVTVVSHEEVVHLATFHIRSISFEEKYESVNSESNSSSSRSVRRKRK